VVSSHFSRADSMSVSGVGSNMSISWLIVKE
jgi:hypothetical protein